MVQKKFNTSIKSKIYNNLLKKGKKSISEKIFLGVTKNLQKTSLKKHQSIITSVIVNTTPLIKLKSIKRKRRPLRQFPYILDKNKRLNYGLKFFLQHHKKQKKKNKSILKISEDLLSSCKNPANSTMKYKEDIYEISLKTKKQAHFRWF